MTDVRLLTRIGVADADDLLVTLIGALERAFPNRIRAYYLGGSYSDGSAVGQDRSTNSSDIDLFAIFRGAVSVDEAATFQRITDALRATSPIQIDAHAYAEDDLLQPSRPETTQASFLNALIRSAGLPLYGDDLRADLPEVPFARYVLDVIESGVFLLGVPRQRDSLAFPLDIPLVAPLAYPDPDGELYGYDVVPARPDTPRGTRVLVGIATWIATLILALETGRYACQKSQSIALCKQYLPGDERTCLAADIYDTCKREWGHLLPESAEDRARLRSWLQDILAVENDYLRLCHDFLVARLQQGDDAERRQAVCILQSVTFDDAEIFSALSSLEHSANELIRIEAAKAVQVAARAVEDRNPSGYRPSRAK
jgi:hypothetical protein